MRMVARLIDRDGDAYWPILDRLEAERDHYLSRRKRLEFHLHSNINDEPSISGIRSDTTLDANSN